MNFRLILLISQIYIHILFFYGLYNFSATFTIPVIVVSHIIFSGICGTVFFHRVVAHKNSIKPIYENLLLAISTIGLSGSALAWVATHRMHHRYSDTIRDPHCPKYNGLLKTYFYSSADSSSIRYVVDLLKDKRYTLQHKYYFHINIVYHTLLFVMLPFHLYWMACIVPGFVMWFTGSIINCFSHNSSGPTNNDILGFLFAGEGWHKNHHLHASNPQFNIKYDWGYKFYTLLK